ncbi:phosphoenolpyruvate carboxylase [Shigella flexneri]
MSGKMNEQYSASRSNVSMLGKALGETIKDALAEHILERVENIASRPPHALAMMLTAKKVTTLQNLSSYEALPVAREFSQFLNLANTASNTTAFRRKAHCQPPEVIAPHPA